LEQFLAKIKRLKGPDELLIRMTKFGDQNIIRIAARFRTPLPERIGKEICHSDWDLAYTVFAVPLLIISIDGLTANKPLNHKSYLADILLMLGLVGFTAQAAITYAVSCASLRESWM
jgi:hypothetical protein